MKTMSGNEIVEALEYCANHKECDDGCPCVIAEVPCVMNNPNALLNLINHQKAEIEALNAYAKTTSELAFRARQDMTSVTRFVRLEKDSPNYDKYKELAEQAVKNILKSLNDNPDLAEIEKYNHKHNVKENFYG